MPTNTSGISRFFGGLAAGPALRQRAAALGRQEAMREALTDAQIRNTGAEASLRQDRLAALDPSTISQAFSGFGLNDAQAQGAGTLVRSGQNVNEIGQLMRSLASQQAQRAARDAALSGDLNAANANLFGVATGPQALSKVEGGVALNPLVTPDQNSFNPTAVGQAMVAADMARANASNASAARSRAGIATDKASNYETIDTGNGLVRHNKLTNEVMPITDADGTQLSKAMRITPTAAPANVAQSILGSELNSAGLPVTNPEANQMFLAWQARQAATDPRYQNGEFALSQYALQQPAGALLSGRDENGKVVTSAVEPAGISKEFADAIANKPTAPNGESPAEQGGSQNPSSQIRETTAAEIDPGQPKAPQGVVRVSSKAERDALADGTPYLDPYGKVRIKRGGGQ